MRKWFLITAVSLLLLCIALVLLPFAIEFGSKKVFRSLGVKEIRIHDVDFNPFSGILIYKNLELLEKGKPVLSFSKLLVQLSLTDLFQKHLLVEKVFLQDAKVHISRLPTGDFQFGSIVLPLNSKEYNQLQNKKPEITSPAWGGGVKSFEILKSSLEISDSEGDFKFEIKEARLADIYTWKENGGGTFALNALLNDTPIKLDLKLAPFSQNPKMLGRINIGGLDLSNFQPYTFGLLTLLEGKLQVDMEFKLHQKNNGRMEASAQGSTGVGNLKLENTESQGALSNLDWNGLIRVEAVDGKEEYNILADGVLTGGAVHLAQPAEKLEVSQDGFEVKSNLKANLKKESMQADFKGGVQLGKTDILISGREIENENIQWNGSWMANLAPEKKQFELSGMLEGGTLKVKEEMTGKDLGYGNFTVSLDSKGVESTEGFTLTQNGKVSVLAINVSDGKDELKQERMSWDGNITMTGKTISSTSLIALEGELGVEETLVLTTIPKMKIGHSRLTWSGKVSIPLAEESIPITSQGELSLQDFFVDRWEGDFKLLGFRELGVSGINVEGLNNILFNSLHLDDAYVGRKPSAYTLATLKKTELTLFELREFKNINMDALDLYDLSVHAHKKKSGTWLGQDELLFAEKSSAPKSKFSDESQHLPPARGSSEKSGTKATVPKKDLPKNPVQLALKKFHLQGKNSISYQDLNVTPGIKADLQDIDLLISGVSSTIPDQQTYIELKARVGEYSTLSLTGNIQPFKEALSGKIASKVTMFDLPLLSPYAEKTLGYNLTSGTLDGDVDLLITKGKMMGETRLKLNNLTVQPKDKEKLKQLTKELTMPLDTALSMLRDKNNDIKIDLPITGDLANPKIGFSDVINQAMGAALKKAALTYVKNAFQPYGVIFDVVMFAGKKITKIKLEPVIFNKGGDIITEESLPYLDHVAKLMGEREKLRLKLCGVALDQERYGNPGNQPVVGPPAGAAPTPDSINASAETSDETLSLSRPPLSDENLIKLANTRSSRLKDFWVKEKGIHPSRLFSCKAEIKDDSKGKPRVELQI